MVTGIAHKTLTLERLIIKTLSYYTHLGESSKIIFMMFSNQRSNPKAKGDISVPGSTVTSSHKKVKEVPEKVTSRLIINY